MFHRIAFAFYALLFFAPAGKAFHIIEVLDDQTNRGVPLVELETTNHIRYITDSAGIVAFDEPGLMDRDVWFDIKSHGYNYKKDGFGYAGANVKTKQGQKTTLKIKRINIAERIYRITGQGIYGHSVRAGLKAPIEQPVLNGEVMGQDSCLMEEYNGKMLWLWGDTARVRYPLGQFGMSGATSEWPGKGGLDPNIGVNLKYFVDKEGFSRKMADVSGEGAVWIDGIIFIKDPQGRQRMVGRFSRMKSLGEMLERGLVLYNDEKQVFERWKTLDKDEPLYPMGHAFRYTDNGVEWCYFPAPYPAVRVKPDWNAVQDPHQYQGFTCLKPGARYEKDKTDIERDASGKVVWAWKTDTAPIRENEQKELIAAGKLKPEEGQYDLKDVETGKHVAAHSASIYWNDYRKKWITIINEFGGSTSLLGEVWFAEADRPEGPFQKARKIVTHDKQTFYNVTQHPQFDQEGGRIIYFEGTYTNSFSGNPDATPQYEYNQIMYRLDLSDPRLKLD